MSRFIGELLLLWVLGASAIEVALCGYDKLCAKMGWWRVPERVLLLWAAIGGGIGLGAGMLLFRHKTRHRVFRVTAVISSALYIAAVLYTIEGIGLLA